MKPPSETKLRDVERELRKRAPGAQRAVGGGVYMRLGGEGRRRFTHRALKGRAGGTADTWPVTMNASRTLIPSSANMRFRTPSSRFPRK